MKKLISLLLVLCMAFSLMAMSVSADEVTVPENNQAENFQDDLEYVYGAGIYDEEQDVDAYLTSVVTRGDYALYIARLLNADTSAAELPAGELADVAALKDTDAELYHAIAWCFNNKIVYGYRDGNYYPAKEVTREEICALIYRSVKEGKLQMPTNETPNITTLVDSESISGYAQDAVAFCIEYGIIVGDNNGNFNSGDGMKTVHMAAVLNRFANNETQAQNTTKFVLSVETGTDYGYATITVNDAYIMQVTLSEKELDASNITLGAAMYNVGSLGVGETGKTHSVNIGIADLEGRTPALPDWMKLTWGAVEDGYATTINIDIAGASCTYNVTAEQKEAEQEVVFTFVPADVEETRTAWHTLVNDETIGKTEYAEDDSKIVIAYGSYLQLGYQVLEMEDDNIYGLTLDNFNDLSALKAAIREAVMVTEAADPAVAAKLAKGTKLRVGQTEAELLENVEVIIEGIACEDMEYLSDLRDSTSTYDMAVLLVGALDAVVSGMNGESVDVLVNIG